MKKKHDKIEEQELNPEESIIEEIKEETAKEEEHNYLEDLQRVQAEFANYMKRVEKERLHLKDLGKREILLKLLQLHDAFEAGMIAVKQTENRDELLKGMELIQKEFAKLLEEEHVRPIQANGSFDPHRHDAVAHVEGEEDGLIVEEVKKGWMFKDMLLRPSMVKVSKIKQEPEENIIEIDKQSEEGEKIGSLEEKNE